MSSSALRIAVAFACAALVDAPVPGHAATPALGHEAAQGRVPGERAPEPPRGGPTVHGALDE